MPKKTNAENIDMVFKIEDAIKNSDTKAAQALFDSDDIMGVTILDEALESWLQIAIKKQHAGMFKLLYSVIIERFGNKDCVIKVLKTSSKGLSPLMQAINKNNIEFIKALMDTELISETLQSTSTSELGQAFYNRPEGLNHNHHRLPKNAKLGDGYTKFETLQTLLEYDIWKNLLRDKYKHPDLLSCVVRFNVPQDVELLLQSGADISMVAARTSNTVLHDAVLRENTDMLAMLLEKDETAAFINQKNREGYTPLSLAMITKGHEAHTKLLFGYLKKNPPKTANTSKLLALAVESRDKDNIECCLALHQPRWTEIILNMLLACIGLGYGFSVTYQLIKKKIYGKPSVAVVSNEHESSTLQPSKPGKSNKQSSKISKKPKPKKEGATSPAKKQ